jgi:hypothetical protein
LVKEQLIPTLSGLGAILTELPDGICVVSAAIQTAVSKDADIGLIFNRMFRILKTKLDLDPSWGPRYISHPGDVARHVLNDAY